MRQPDISNNYFKAHDHHRLYYECVRPKSPKAVLVLVHGLGEHLGRYSNPVREFGKDHTVYLYDHRGHGRSDGVRTHVDSFDQFIADLREFIEIVAKRHKGMPLFLIGHSMGGQIVIGFAAKYPSIPITGLITSSANVRIALKVNKLKRFLGKNISKILPKLRLNNEIDPQWICRDSEVVSAYKKDPLVSKGLSAKLACEVLAHQAHILELAEKIKIPVLMLHAGDDRICDPRGTVAFYERLATADKTYKIYPGMYHEIFNEVGKEEVFTDMRRWMDERAGV